MRLIRKKSDWWITLAIYGSGAICWWMIFHDPWKLTGVFSFLTSLALLSGVFFVGAIFYAPARVLWDWITDRRNGVE